MLKSITPVILRGAYGAFNPVWMPGGYMVTEGPSNWAALDSRGDISAEHTADFEKNVLPLTTGQGQSAYFDFQADLGTVQLTDYADKILVTHITAKPGKINAVKIVL